jgi:hypothetical protein
MQLEHATSAEKATLRCTSVDGSTQPVHRRNRTSREPHQGSSFLDQLPQLLGTRTGNENLHQPLSALLPVRGGRDVGDSDESPK